VMTRCAAGVEWFAGGHDFQSCRKPRQRDPGFSLCGNCQAASSSCRIFFHSAASCDNRNRQADVVAVLAACRKRRAIIARRSSTKFLVVF